VSIADSGVMWLFTVIGASGLAIHPEPLQRRHFSPAHFAQRSPASLALT
jgi:hypothetical protein